MSEKTIFRLGRGRIYLEYAGDIILDQYMSWKMINNSIHVIPYDEHDKSAVITVNSVTVDGWSYKCNTSPVFRQICRFEQCDCRYMHVRREDDMVVFDGYCYSTHMGKFRIPCVDLNKAITRIGRSWFHSDIMCTVFGLYNCTIDKHEFYDICRVTMDAEPASC